MLIVISSVFLIVLSFAAITPPTHEFKNLQVLPKNISGEALDKIMDDEFCKGLGVKCGYCHAKNEAGDDLDFASDAKSEKEIARKMMRMTMEVNDKYFGTDHAQIGDSLSTVHCITCHRENPFPVTASNP